MIRLDYFEDKCRENPVTFLFVKEPIIISKFIIHCYVYPSHVTHT